MTDTDNEFPSALDLSAFADLHSAVDLRDTTGFYVDDTDDDDPVLLTKPSGHIVDTWREDYPYDERMGRSEYELAETPAADRAAEAAELDQGDRAPAA